MRYFDSGVLLKLYLREPNSGHAVALVQEHGAAPPLTALHRLEMKAAVGQRHGRGEITGAERTALLADFENDLAAGVFTEITPGWTTVFARAETLAAAHASANLCRSLVS